MKKTVYLFMFALMSLTFVPTANANVTDPVITENTNAETSARVKVLMSRLEEIKEMDKSSMTRSQKKELRKEVKAIKSELKSTGNGVYLSVGAIIIIILLLILLL